MELVRNILLLSLIISLPSCGYFGDEPVKNSEVYNSETLSGGCVLEPEEFSQIFKKDIEGQINCLEEKLSQFVKYVRREKAASISERELGSFVRRFWPSEEVPLIIGGLKIIFGVNGIFLKDNSSFLNIDNIKPLFNLLRISNKRVYRLINLVDKKNNLKGKVDIVERSIQVHSELKVLVAHIVELMNGARGRDLGLLNLEEFLEKIKDQFSIRGLKKELWQGFFSLKRLFLGGEEELLTRRELFRFLEMVPDLGSAAYIFYYARRDRVEKANHLYELYQSQVVKLQKYIYPHKRGEKIFSRDSFENLLNRFIPDEGISWGEGEEKRNLSRRKINDLIVSLKVNILGGSLLYDGHTFQEVQNLFKVLNSTFSALSFYESYKILSKEEILWENWEEKRESFLEKVRLLQEGLAKQWLDSESFPSLMTPIPFIQDLMNSLHEGFEHGDQIDSLFRMFKLLTVGGEGREVTKNQFVDLIFKLDDVGEIFFDIVFSHLGDLGEQNSRRIYFLSIPKINKLIIDEPFLHIITVDELLSAASYLFENKAIQTYSSTIETMKFKILGGYPQELTLKDVRRIISLVEEFFSQRYFVDISYDLYQKALSSKNIITSFKYDKKHEDFRFFEVDKLKKYKKQFEDQIKKIRVFRYRDGTQYYGDDVRRSKFGILEYYMAQFFFDLIGQSLGHKNDKNEYVLNIDEVNHLLYVFKPVLIHMGLWSAEPETFGRNTLLLADLFQANSDGSTTIDFLEASEYGTLALFAINIGDKIIEKMNKYCRQYTRKGTKGFAVECYRPHFFPILLDELGMGKKLPKLNTYIKTSSSKEVMDFLLAIEGFAKDYPEKGMPETRRDIILLCGAILNIESTFLRFDSNKSNLLDPSELDIAFPIYKEAICSLADLKGDRRKYAKSIFLYMIKEMTEPSNFDVIFYHYNPFAKKRISSKRLNVGALLYNMVFASGKKK